MATRSNNFVASFQIEALCHALRTLAACNLEPDNAARSVLRSLRDGFVKSGTGEQSPIFQKSAMIALLPIYSSSPSC